VDGGDDAGVHTHRAGGLAHRVAVGREFGGVQVAVAVDPSHGALSGGELGSDSNCLLIQKTIDILKFCIIKTPKSLVQYDHPLKSRVFWAPPMAGGSSVTFDQKN
jgi:hypothetical protein